jgi:hypothetical protein
MAALVESNVTDRYGEWVADGERPTEQLRDRYGVGAGSAGLTNPSANRSIPATKPQYLVPSVGADN